ncbi:hypothetical protein LUU34_01425300 [Aix galericulata]|nr:hypothetical protein LUU34_01425300 [Aix galericulata]
MALLCPLLCPPSPRDSPHHCPCRGVSPGPRGHGAGTLPSLHLASRGPRPSAICSGAGGPCRAHILLVAGHVRGARCWRWRQPGAGPKTLRCGRTGAPCPWLQPGEDTVRPCRSAPLGARGSSRGAAGPELAGSWHDPGLAPALFFGVDVHKICLTGTVAGSTCGLTCLEPVGGDGLVTLSSTAGQDGRLLAPVLLPLALLPGSSMVFGRFPLFPSVPSLLPVPSRVPAALWLGACCCPKADPVAWPPSVPRCHPSCSGGRPGSSSVPRGAERDRATGPELLWPVLSSATLRYRSCFSPTCASPCRCLRSVPCSEPDRQFWGAGALVAPAPLQPPPSPTRVWGLPQGVPHPAPPPSPNAGAVTGAVPVPGGRRGGAGAGTVPLPGGRRCRARTGGAAGRCRGGGGADYISRRAAGRPFVCLAPCARPGALPRSAAIGGDAPAAAPLSAAGESGAGGTGGEGGSGGHRGEERGSRTHPPSRGAGRARCAGTAGLRRAAGAARAPAAVRPRVGAQSQGHATPPWGAPPQPRGVPADTAKRRCRCVPGARRVPVPPVPGGAGAGLGPCPRYERRPRLCRQQARLWESRGHAPLARHGTARRAHRLRCFGTPCCPQGLAPRSGEGMGGGPGAFPGRREVLGGWMWGGGATGLRYEGRR